MFLLTRLYNLKFQLILIVLFSAITYYMVVLSFYSDCAEFSSTVSQTRTTRKKNFYLVDIVRDSVEPKNDKNLFFIDTFRMQPEYNERRSEKIGKRQACAFESAALFNPHLNVYVVYITRDDDPKLKITPELEALMKYTNIKFVSIQHNDFPIGTPLGSFFINNQEISESKFVVAHMSDAYRLLILWKYGGVYYDTDVISLKTVENSPDNFACDDGEGDIVANGIMRFDTQKGRNFTEMFMNYMIENYDADEWGTNGPVVITKVLSEICETDSVSEMIEMINCDGFHVLPRTVCYPIPWTRWKRIFNEVRVDKMMEMVNDSMTLHLWNNLSKRRRIEIEKDTVFNRIAMDKCPEIYKIMIGGG